MTTPPPRAASGAAEQVPGPASPFAAGFLNPTRAVGYLLGLRCALRAFVPLAYRAPIWSEGQRGGSPWRAHSPPTAGLPGRRAAGLQDSPSRSTRRTRGASAGGCSTVVTRRSRGQRERTLPGRWRRTRLPRFAKQYGRSPPPGVLGARENDGPRDEPRTPGAPRRTGSLERTGPRRPRRVCNGCGRAPNEPRPRPFSRIAQARLGQLDRRPGGEHRGRRAPDLRPAVSERTAAPTRGVRDTCERVT